MKNNRFELYQNVMIRNCMSLLFIRMTGLSTVTKLKWLERRKSHGYYLLDNFGFQRNISTSRAISPVFDNSLKNVDKKHLSCCLLLDFTKALNTVDNNVLLRKMSDQFGIRGPALKFFKSYSSNRQHYVRINNSLSKMEIIKCGVLQGLNLVLLLFLTLALLFLRMTVTYLCLATLC